MGMLAGLALLAVPVEARAEDEKPFEEPGIVYLPRQEPYIQWLAGGLIVVACLAVAFKNPHRTHFD